MAMENAAVYTPGKDALTPRARQGMLDAFIARFRFSGKMYLLLALILLLTLGGNLLSALHTRDEIRAVIKNGLVSHVESFHNHLEKQLAADPANFLAMARKMMNDARWGEDRSGYLFLTDTTGRVVIHPVNPAGEGNLLEPTPLQDSDETLPQALARIGRGDIPEELVYPFAKPGTNQQVLKDVAVYPLAGKYLLIGGVYLDAADDSFNNFLQQSALQLVVVTLLLLGVITLFTRAIGKQVHTVEHGLKAITNQDLTQKLVATGKDEFAAVTRALDLTRQNLAELLFQQRDVSLSLSATSAQTDDGMGQVNHAIIEQRERLDGLATAMEQMTTTIREVAQNAQLMADNTQATDRLASDGVSKIASAIEAIRILCENLASSADSVNEVEQKVSVISSVVDTINGISEQTNLLALNAAIEAARAGEQGRGFAVVADEVRQLAKRTQQATQEIADMITALQKGTHQAVDMMKTSVNTAQQAMDEASVASDQFGAIAQQTGQLSERSEMVAAASEEQSLVANQVTDSLVVIRDAVEETEQVAKELSQASHNLKQQAHTMEQIVGSYHLPAR